MASINNVEYEDIDEAEEEALLKSDDENDVVMKGQLDADEDGVDLVDENIEDDDDSDSDGDSYSDDEIKQSKQYLEMLETVEKNPYVYDNYVRLCEFAHASQNLDFIRHAYLKFADAYPLSAELWLKYLQIEVDVAQSLKEIECVKQLYITALKDYYSIDIAFHFAQFAARCSNADEIWQELLGTYGLHIMRGRELYNKYRKNLKIAKDPAKQKAYVNSFLQELKYPLHDMEESYIEFKVFYEKNKAQLEEPVDWEAVDKAYFKAKEHLQKILPFEQQLLALESHCYRERAEVYQRYIKETDKFLDENVLQTVYERMVADCCLNAECWLTYVDFLSYRDAYGHPKELQQFYVFQQQAEDVLQRALRNCPWNEQLYIKRMLLMEQRECTRELVQEVLESSFTAGFQTAEPAVAIWMEYLTYLRRQTDYTNEQDCEILRKNFNLAWTILGQQWGVLADCNCEILQFWGRLEYGPLQDGKRGKELWTTVMESSDNSTKSGLWIEFAQLEMRRDLEGTRNVYRKALNAAGLDNSGVITSAWERFERCNGNIQTLTACKRECAALIATYQKAITITKDTSKQPTKRKAADTESTAKLPAEKRTRVSKQDENNSKSHSQMAAEEHAGDEIDTAKDHLRIFLSNLDYNLTEDDIREHLSELNIVRVDLIRSPNGRSRGFGYLELKSEADVIKALKMDRHNLQGRPMFVSSVLRDKEQRQKFKYSESREPTKLFVKGLPQDSTQTELETLFGAHGKVKDVRLVYHKSGKFKNIAYVDFENEAAAGKALLATNQMDLRGHTLTVAISAPPPKLNVPNTPNLSKMLGFNNRAKGAMEQKPRLTLIPNAVRQKLTADTKAMPPPPTPAAATSSTSSGAVVPTKTNADFRKMLLK